MMKKTESIYGYLIIWLGVSLIVLNGLKLEFFEVDSYAIIIFFILNLTFFAVGLRQPVQIIEKVSFKTEIKEAKKFIDQAVDTAKKLNKADKSNSRPFETFKLIGAKDLLESEPVLAIAALNIEIEQKLNKVKGFLKLSSKGSNSFPKLIEAVAKKKILNPQQAEALKQLVGMGNKAIAGHLISKSEARDILRLADKFNKTFAVGYSIDFEVNEDYQAQDLLCEWAHSIKLMPLIQENGGSFCPRFGHDCPGGKDKAVSCSQTVVSLANKVYVEMVQTSLFDEIKN